MLCLRLLEIVRSSQKNQRELPFLAFMATGFNQPQQIAIKFQRRIEIVHAHHGV